MIRLAYKPEDRRYIFVLHDDQKEIVALEKHLNKIPAYQFMPSFSGIPRPVVFLEKTRVHDKVIYYCLAGLWKEIKNWCAANHIACEGVYNLYDLKNKAYPVPDGFHRRIFPMALGEFENYVRDWHMNIEPRDYQLKASWKILHYRQSMSQLATRAGKTLMAYMIFRYMLENGAHNILMVVPNISLVKQGLTDMGQYKEFFKGEPVWAQGEYVESSNLTIGTFQSLVRRCTQGKRGAVNKHYNPKFFDKFDVVCIDECHKTDCDSIKQILSQPFMKNAKLIFGFSGTLPDPDTIESYGCQALLGPCIQDITTNDLVEEGFLAKPDITQVRIHYKDDAHLTKEYIKYGEYLCSNFVLKDGKHVLLPKEQRDMTMKYAKRKSYMLAECRRLYDDDEYRSILIDLCKAQGANLLVLEQMIAEHSQKKLDTMQEILFAIGKNTIVFAHNEAYIDYLHDYFTRVFPDRPIYKIKGATSPKKRDSIRSAMNTKDPDAILFASYGCVGTGLTFTNIDSCIFAQSFKSKIINLQSIGRGLLLGEDKDTFKVYDLIDCLPTERLKRQGEAKIKTYEKVQYKYRTISK